MFTSAHRHQPWVWQVTALCFVLGLLISGSLQTVTSIRRSGVGATRVGAGSGAGQPLAWTLRQREKEIADLREKQTRLENVLAQGSGKLRALNDELQNAKLLSGLTEVVGPGISLSLRDGKPHSSRALDTSRFTIHDYDLQMVVNELASSGAEAVAVSGQRVVARTAIRCVGPTIMINNVPVSPPYEVLAIGNPDTMAGGLDMPGGYLDDLRLTDPTMFRLERRTRVVVPAYAGSTETKYARPPDPEEDKSHKESAQ